MADYLKAMSEHNLKLITDKTYGMMEWLADLEAERMPAWGNQEVKQADRLSDGPYQILNNEQLKQEIEQLGETVTRLNALLVFERNRRMALEEKVFQKVKKPENNYEGLTIE